MASETDNLILVQLREIRATLNRFESKFEDHDKRFDAIDKTLETLKRP